MHAMGVRFRHYHKQPGRPKGSVKVTDEAIINGLVNHSHESQTIHEALETPVRTLELSKRRAAPLVGLEKSQLCSRLKQCALGFSPAKAQRGRCDPCYAWTWSGRCRLKALFRELRAQVEAIVPTYFTPWDARVADEEWDTYSLEAGYLFLIVANDEYVEVYINYFPRQCLHLRGSYSPNSVYT